MYSSLRTVIAHVLRGRSEKTSSSPQSSCRWGPVFCSNQNLLGGISTPLKNMKVSWDHDIPNIWKVKKFHGSSHHQPEMDQTVPRRSRSKQMDRDNRWSWSLPVLCDAKSGESVSGNFVAGPAARFMEQSGTIQFGSIHNTKQRMQISLCANRPRWCCWCHSGLSCEEL